MRRITNMLERLISISNKISNNCETNLTNDEAVELQKFFVDYLIKEKSYDSLIEKIGKQKYEELVKYTKKLNLDYYAFKIFFSKETSAIEKDLRKIITSGVLTINHKFLQEITKKYGDRDFDFKIGIELARGISNIFYYCIDKNGDVDLLKDIFVKQYKIPEASFEIISDLYVKNRIELKLNYLVNQIGKLKK